MNDTIDPQVKNLVSAIGQAETGPSSPDAYKKPGASGEYGRYQFMPDTWKEYSKEAGVNTPLEQSSIEDQNKVAYYKIKQWKDQGYNPAQIASMWNAGPGKPNAYKENYKGVNSQGVSYDTPAYAAKVSQYYQQNKGQTSSPDSLGYSTSAAIPTAQTGTPEKEQGFIAGTTSDLNKRAQEGLGALGDVIPALQGKGKQNVVSDVLQAGGALGGAIGDVTNRAIEATPIVGAAVKGIEGLIGKGVGALAQTDTGKSVIKSVSDWADKHPELSKDIGAGFNIVTAIPILRGLGVAKNIAMDATAQALKGVAEKGALKDLTAAASRTIGGRKALAETPDALKTIIDERALPDIEGGKYVTKEAGSKLEGAINHADDATDAILQKTTVNGAKPVVDITALRNQALASAKRELEGTSNYKPVVNKINELFDTAEASDRAVVVGGQKFLTLENANFFKRQARKGLKWDDTIGQDAGFHAGQSYMKGIEDIATKNNLGDVHAANQATARLIQAQNMLRHIEGKPVKMGSLGGIIQDTAMAGGEIAGNMTGIPLAGAFLGREGGGFVGKRLSGLRTGLLNRTGKGATRTPLNTSTLKKATKGLVSARAQNTTKHP